ncbi:trypsin-like peptidase domain-containing protein [Streptomyces sp. NBC_00557]|uniref:trypsin-like peptidase domain-containing protein n=1 Tax=Streptomyces sp. NBC_00557 TaxID=2975776 RepID=UPI002E809208|nr:trypsin-like peptidase domain-containing protein [Streptomyces sp. NBC_00557]WUC34030.1 S1 family peptidase [Streptomyces sp. NBC_00557]
MTRTGERAVKSWLRTPSWIARIEAPDGRVLGAGVLLAPDQVLTAGHVVRPGLDYVVRLVGVPELAAVSGTVGEDEHVPPHEDRWGDLSGDLALLRLTEPLPAQHTTRLHRLATPHGPVSMYGFPAGHEGGRWHGATLVAARGRDSQVQLRPVEGELAVPGFSGGGVVDHGINQVIGIVLGVDEGFSYMSPTETILRHLPQVAAWTDGAEAVDPRLRTAASAAGGALDVPFATQLASWFRGEGWPVLVAVAPAHSDRAWTLNRAVTLADRELRSDRNTSGFSHDPPETVPPAGAHDLALDVKGLTAADVMDRIAVRLGIRDDIRPERLGALRVPLTAVLVGVDQSAEPVALLGLADRLARQGARLLLVFRSRGVRADEADELLVRHPLRDRWNRLDTELNRITEELSPILDRLRDRVLPGPGAGRLVEQAEAGVRRTRMLRAWVDHTPEREREPARADLLFTFEDAADRRRQRLEQAIGALEARLRRREELLGRVSAEWPLCRERAAHGDRLMEAYRLYEQALSLLRHTPCDIERAEAAVGRFVGFCSACAPAAPAPPGVPDTPAASHAPGTPDAPDVPGRPGAPGKESAP